MFYALLNVLLSLNTDVNLLTVINKQKNSEKNLLFVGMLKATDEKGWIGNSVYGSKGQDPDP
jgi:hypothetical protein